MKQHSRDLLIDTLHQTTEQVSEILNDIEQDQESARLDWESELSEASERATAAENALREVLDRLDDWHRGLCDRDEVITGPMIRELVSSRFANVSVAQEVSIWKASE